MSKILRAHTKIDKDHEKSQLIQRDFLKIKVHSFWQHKQAAQ